MRLEVVARCASFTVPVADNLRGRAGGPLLVGWGADEGL
jgi:hypothetical protein